MIDKQLYKFYLSCKHEGKVHLEWVEGINLRHAKEKLQFKFPEASDIMDWTNETEESVNKYIAKETEIEEKNKLHKL